MILSDLQLLDRAKKSGPPVGNLHFHPRNEILFLSEQLADTDKLKKLAAEWSSMNWVRSLIVFAGLVFSILSLDKVFSIK